MDKDNISVHEAAPTLSFPCHGDRVGRRGEVALIPSAEGGIAPSEALNITSISCLPRYPFVPGEYDKEDLQPHEGDTISSLRSGRFSDYGLVGPMPPSSPTSNQRHTTNGAAGMTTPSTVLIELLACLEWTRSFGHLLLMCYLLSFHKSSVAYMINFVRARSMLFYCYPLACAKRSEKGCMCM